MVPVDKANAQGLGSGPNVRKTVLFGDGLRNSSRREDDDGKRAQQQHHPNAKASQLFAL